MHVKRWILMILLGAACLLLLASCGSDEHSANTDTSNGPIGTNMAITSFIVVLSFRCSCDFVEELPGDTFD